MKQIFNRFSFYSGKSWNYDFKQIELIPQLTIIINTQESDSFKDKDDNVVFVGFVSYELVLSWLVFCVSFGVNFKTGR